LVVGHLREWSLPWRTMTSMALAPTTGAKSVSENGSSIS
jgi:hypothetical protein